VRHEKKGGPVGRLGVQGGGGGWRWEWGEWGGGCVFVMKVVHSGGCCGNGGSLCGTHPRAERTKKETCLQTEAVPVRMRVSNRTTDGTRKRPT